MFDILFPLSVSQFYKFSTLLRWRFKMLSVVILFLFLIYPMLKVKLADCAVIWPGIELSIEDRFPSQHDFNCFFQFRPSLVSCMCLIMTHENDVGS